MKKVLTIAGSDSSGGAGIQADLKTFQANGVYGMSVITALTAQNTQGVRGVFNSSRDFVGQQMDAVFTDIFPDAVKIGMVAEAAIIEEIVQKLQAYGASNIVVDPVMVATSGSNLMEDSAVKTLKEKLLPLASLITPNMSEAGVLAGIKVHNKETMLEAGEIISQDLPGALLIKGGHLEDRADDLLIIAGEKIWLEGERLDNENTHGTGCTLSSAIASNLAKGYEMREAIEGAKTYLTGAIADGLNLGQGRGPLNHGYNLRV